MKKRNTLSYKQMIRAKCKDCMCDYIDGRRDCEVETCPLYPAMPYGKLKKTSRPLPEQGQALIEGKQIFQTGVENEQDYRRIE